MTQPKTVDFWFDPACPWAWMTSRWIIEASKLRDLDVRWNVMSLYVLNEPKLDELPEQYRAFMPGTLPAVRVATAVAEQYDNETLGRLYTALGNRIHLRKDKDPESYIPSALDAVGLPADLAAAAKTDEWDEALRASHQRGIGLVGTDVGTPVVAVENDEGVKVGLFGPVVTPAPQGEAAAKLWDGVYAVTTTPGFYELKRSRTDGPNFDNLVDDL
ncbi:MAG: disulfide bond formation protein DsbA [Glycomyces artemisiae]|uniref:Disulfide bond formation protein DsbA n=1 Tax=Glycomyces artemisiae TaxID=1076443 RepID=A0A2T0UVZ4_9ACTN|nr:DsbA family protein [Glycomyces artemisiae]NUQ90706.1 disulfide bond formation protein DsbA [Glycomyces artemisiae]PRY62102.1 putative DsbA family dithiol-disulfide isomerase [Glycomyces artemisiae]